MREMNKSNVSNHIRNSLPEKKILYRRTKKNLQMMRQREVDAMVEITRNQLMDRYDN